MNKNALLGAAIAAAALLHGCASQVYNKQALSQPNNRFAIVSFGGLTSGLGMDQEADAKMITGLDEVVYQELSRSKHFTLVRPGR